MTAEGSRHLQLTVTSESEVRVTRTFYAPQEGVFEMLTDSRQLARWLGGRGAEAPECAVHPRPGGTFRVAFPPGATPVRALRGAFHDLTAPSRVACSCALGLRDGRDLPIEIAVGLSERDGVTVLKARIGFAGSEDRDAYLEAGLAHAATDSYDRLAEVLAVDTTPAAADELVVARLLDAHPEEVFVAWTEPTRLEAWWGPPGFEMAEQRLELRPGGMHLYGMRPPGGPVTWGKSVYREIQPPERLVYLSSAADAAGRTVRNAFAPEWPLAVLNTVTLFDADGRTMLILRGRPEAATAAERAAFAAARGHVSRALEATFARLQGHLGEGGNEAGSGRDGSGRDGSGTLGEDGGKGAEREDGGADGKAD